MKLPEQSDVLFKPFSKCLVCLRAHSDFLHKSSSKSKKTGKHIIEIFLKMMGFPINFWILEEFRTF